MSPDTREGCARALTLLESARDQPPAKLSSQVDDAERLLVSARDALIDRLRRDPGSPRRTLDHLNAALSLVVGVEYPGAGIQRRALDQASRAIRAALDSEAA
jgi:hypothetical protein